MNEYIKLINTGEIIKNEFYYLETHGKNTQNSFYKDVKIQNFMTFANLNTQIHMPNFIQREMPYNIIYSEAHLEEYRSTFYPEYPSRLASFFVFDSLESVKKYKESNNQYQNNKIFRLKLKGNYKISKHNMEYISVLRTVYNTPIFEQVINNFNIISKYWMGEGSDFDYSMFNSTFGIIPPTFEYMIEGEFESTPIDDIFDAL